MVVPAPSLHLLSQTPHPARRYHLGTHGHEPTCAAHTGTRASPQLPPRPGPTSSHLCPDHRSQTLPNHGCPLLLVPTLVPVADLGPERRYPKGEARGGHTLMAEASRGGSWEAGVWLSLGHMSAQALPQAQALVLGRWWPRRPSHPSESKEHRCGCLMASPALRPVCAVRAHLITGPLPVAAPLAEKPLPSHHQHQTSSSNNCAFGGTSHQASLGPR